MKSLNATNPCLPNPCSNVDPLSGGCPSRSILDLVGDRWSLLVMLVVGRGARRNGEILRAIGGISQKMLTQTLRALEAHGLVRRIDFQTVPPHVEYELTHLGRSLEVAMLPLHQWVEANFEAVQAALAASQDQAGRTATASNFARNSGGNGMAPVASV